MQLLPRDFLTQLARKYQLSPEQEEAFVERFSSNESEPSVAEALHISHNAFRTRLSGVYSKFSIGGKGPGKFHRLRDFLMEEYQKSNPPRIPVAMETVSTSIPPVPATPLRKLDSQLEGFTTGSKVSHNLPHPDYGQFIGREQELAKAMRILRPYPHSQHSLVTVDGVGGIGKSVLALEIAHRFLRKYDKLLPEERFAAIVWTSAKQTVLRPGCGIVSRRQSLCTLDDICKAIAVTLGIEDQLRSKPEDSVELIRRLLTQQRTLLILDNLETVDDEAVMEFLQELPVPTKAVVTTRHRIDVAYPVRLVGMPWEDAKALIELECQKKEVFLGEEQKRKLYERTGGVPLAIVWSIAQIGFGYAVEMVLARIGNPKEDIARFCFEGAVEQIRGKDAYKLLLTLALCKGEGNRDQLGYVAGFGEDRISRDEGLVQLEKLSLVNKQGNLFKMLPLTKEYAASELETAANFKTEAILRLSKYWIKAFPSTDDESPTRKTTRMKVVICGPDNSGKSCLREGLKQAILPIQYAPYPYVISAKPDGEGTWFSEAARADPENAERLRQAYEAQFTSEFAALRAQWVSSTDLPLTVIDVAGKISPENRLIMSQATHAVILTRDMSQADAWKKFCTELNLKVIALIHSDYGGKADRIEAEEPLLVGSIHYLERGEDISQRPIVQVLARLLVRQTLEGV